MISDIVPLVEACRGKLQINIDYTKKTTGETVHHQGGIYEIDGNILWLWDTNLNDNIRKFLIENINSFEVLNVAFFPPQPFPIKINGEIVG